MSKSISAYLTDGLRDVLSTGDSRTKRRYDTNIPGTKEDTVRAREIAIVRYRKHVHLRSDTKSQESGEK
jgi:hypothetical protein